MKNTIIVDTGYILALRNLNDKHHRHALACAGKFHTQRFITTWPVLTETYYLLMNRLSTHDAIALLNAVKLNAFIIFPLNQDHSLRLIQLCETYADLPMDLADASLVVLAESLGHGKILSTDQRDFKTYRWKNKKPFKNLMIN